MWYSEVESGQRVVEKVELGLARVGCGRVS